MFLPLSSPGSDENTFFIKNQRSQFFQQVAIYHSRVMKQNRKI